MTPPPGLAVWEWGHVVVFSLGGLLVILWLVFLWPGFRLDRRRITCPKCRGRVRATPREDTGGEPGGACPACGEWFPLDTWEQMTVIDF